MTINLSLEPQEEATLIVLAQKRGVTPTELVRQVIEKIIADAQEPNKAKQPTISLRGLLAKYGTAPSAEEIDQNRAEMFADFPRADF